MFGFEYNKVTLVKVQRVSDKKEYIVRLTPQVQELLEGDALSEVDRIEAARISFKKTTVYVPTINVTELK